MNWVSAIGEFLAAIPEPVRWAGAAVAGVVAAFSVNYAIWGRRDGNNRKRR